MEEWFVALYYAKWLVIGGSHCNEQQRLLMFFLYIFIVLFNIVFSSGHLLWHLLPNASASQNSCKTVCQYCCKIFLFRIPVEARHVMLFCWVPMSNIYCLCKADVVQMQCSNVLRLLNHCFSWTLLWRLPTKNWSEYVWRYSLMHCMCLACIFICML